jgi:hypothetical protein
MWEKSAEIGLLRFCCRALSAAPGGSQAGFRTLYRTRLARELRQQRGVKLKRSPPEERVGSLCRATTQEDCV